MNALEIMFSRGYQGVGSNVQAARSRERRNRWGAQEDVGVSFFGFTVLPRIFSL